MDSSNVPKEEIVKKAKELIEEYEAGNDQSASAILDHITKLHENTLFSELGKLTRELHNALNSFHLDVRLTDIAEQEIPDAKERLNYVIDMTDKSAHIVLEAAEESLPLAQDIQDTAVKLQELWRRFMNRDMDVNEFREVAYQLKEFFFQVEENATQMKKNLSEVIMAQDFQDLTGQIIRRVINLVQDVEDNLVNLIKLSGGVEQKGQKGEAKKTSDNGLCGPKVPGVDNNTDTVAGQDEVDELLSSLGF